MGKKMKRPARRRRGLPRVPAAFIARPRMLMRWRTEGESQGQLLSLSCRDPGSQNRLANLLHRLSSHDHGVVQSVVAELQLASALLAGGFQVTFLSESRSRTADLECRRGHDRVFVEVTAMLTASCVVPGPAAVEEAEEPQPLTRRLLARIRQKAKQLEDYCAPVLLAITVAPTSPEERWVRRRRPKALRREPADLKRMVGAITIALPVLPHISGVLLSLWDVEPVVDRSGLRLANVFMVQRPSTQPAMPRVRALVVNPVARFPLGTSVREALKDLL